MCKDKIKSVKNDFSGVQYLIFTFFSVPLRLQISQNCFSCHYVFSFFFFVRTSVGLYDFFCLYNLYNNITLYRRKKRKASLNTYCGYVVAGILGKLSFNQQNSRPFGTHKIIRSINLELKRKLAFTSQFF